MTTRINEQADGTFTLELDVPRTYDWPMKAFRPITQAEVDELEAIKREWGELMGTMRKILATKGMLIVHKDSVTFTEPRSE